MNAPHPPHDESGHGSQPNSQDAQPQHQESAVPEGSADASAQAPAVTPVDKSASDPAAAPAAGIPTTTHNADTTQVISSALNKGGAGQPGSGATQVVRRGQTTIDGQQGSGAPKSGASGQQPPADSTQLVPPGQQPPPTPMYVPPASHGYGQPQGFAAPAGQPGVPGGQPGVPGGQPGWQASPTGRGTPPGGQPGWQASPTGQGTPPGGQPGWQAAPTGQGTPQGWPAGSPGGFPMGAQQPGGWPPPPPGQAPGGWPGAPGQQPAQQGWPGAPQPSQRPGAQPTQQFPGAPGQQPNNGWPGAPQPSQRPGAPQQQQWGQQQWGAQPYGQPGYGQQQGAKGGSLKMAVYVTWGLLAVGLIMSIISMISVMNGPGAGVAIAALVISLLITAGIGACAWAAGQGHGWGRTVITVLAGLNVLFALFGIASSPLLSILRLLVGVGLIVVWWLPATSAELKVKQVRQRPY